MSLPKTDVLIKPDMRAVLERTHIGKDLHGFLLPVLEAVSNAMHGIDARFGSSAQKNGNIEIKIDNLNDPKRIFISVTDNGIGLDDKNYEYFKTPFSGHKLKQHGRGFGRFIAFKVFYRILYSTVYQEKNDSKTRTFRFDINQNNEIIFFDGTPDFNHMGLRVDYNEPLEEWNFLISTVKKDEIKDHIGSHFLPYFLNSSLPKISIKFDDDDSDDITTYFNNIFSPSKEGEFLSKIGGVEEKIYYHLTKITKTSSFKNHCLLFSAANRIVGRSRNLTNVIGKSHFQDEENNSYVVIAVVKSEAFESRLNDSRTQINISHEETEEITSSISDIIQEEEKEQIGKIKKQQTLDLKNALIENPILRLGLRGKSLSDYVKQKPNNWTAQNFVSDLAIERYRSSRDLTKLIAQISDNPDSYIKDIKSITQKIDSNNKEALAEYVVHRKKVIELVEIARKMGSSGNYAPEETIHDLIFKRFSDNTQMDYFQHNLWLVDDALAFLPYVSSDRAMHGKGRKKGDKIPDLALFDDSIVLGDNDGTLISIIEFKKPSRTEYKFGDIKNDPVLQVIETLEQAESSGGISKYDGTYFAFRGVVRKCAYIVADITENLLKILRKHDFKNDANPDIFVRYRDNEGIFIQALGYDTLIANAKKRNQAFFSVLFDE
ncbi:sensor histidine kinase [Acetobacter persici]|uniref:ATP-binding protein n=1 Tax=Acetobacter persici TaxID=1076596 RepID=UPI0020CD3A6E|nr:ATP-binding protein [Acetobacter persici]MCP9319152.1 sensor histidine kinase [Acetobacter persici]